MDVNEVDAAAEQLTPVQTFYKGANVFVTGGTGFLGKILIEKLLRSTDVSTIYLLIREKKGSGILARIDELLDDCVFDRLKKEKPKYKHRVVGVKGDCSLAGLGISITDRQMLIRNANVVFHVAATVKFDESLRLAYAINVNGTRYVVDLCRQLEKLKAFIHVSTAYANCHLKAIEEKFYDYSVNYEDIGCLLDKMSDEEIDSSTKQLLGNWPNTYSFTKALAETLIREQTNGLPVGVYRPAVVISSYKEPFSSWVDNLYGPTGICVACASGILRTLWCDENLQANIVPVDTCVAALIASAWQVGQQKTERIPENIPIYNYVASKNNGFTWKEFINLNVLYGRAYPFPKLMWCITLETTTSKFFYEVRKITYHVIPAIFLDALLFLTGKKPKMLRMYNKVHKFVTVLEYFATRHWEFQNDNIPKLYDSLNEADKKLFPMSMDSIHWMQYFKTYVLGIRQYFMKEPNDSLEECRNRLDRLEMVNEVFKRIVAFIMISMLWMCLSKIFFM